MSNRYSRQKCDVIVTKLDLTEEKKKAFKFIKEFGKDTENMTDISCCGGDLGYIEVDGYMYVLDSEGVGCSDPISGECPLVIGWMATRRNEDGSEYFNCMPEATFNFEKPEEIKALGSEKVMLHDFIRSFSHRLEENYWVWVKELKGKYLEEV